MNLGFTVAYGEKLNEGWQRGGRSSVQLADPFQGGCPQTVGSCGPSCGDGYFNFIRAAKLATKGYPQSLIASLSRCHSRCCGRSPCRHTARGLDCRDGGEGDLE